MTYTTHRLTTQQRIEELSFKDRSLFLKVLLNAEHDLAVFLFSHLKIPSVEAPWCCSTDSARVGKIHGSLSEGNRLAWASMTSSRVAPNMDG